MGARSWLRNLLNPEPRVSEPRPSRHERREAARRRASRSDEPHWTEQDLVPRRTRRTVNDTGGLGMGIGGQRTIDD